MGKSTEQAATCPFLPESANEYSPCGFYGQYYGCIADWTSPSEECKEWVGYYCLWGDYHQEVGYTDPACADFYDLFVECEFNSLTNDETTAVQVRIAV